MQERHIQDVRTLYQWQAQDYYDEMVDLAQSKPDIEYPDVEVCTDWHHSPYHGSLRSGSHPID